MPGRRVAIRYDDREEFFTVTSFRRRIEPSDEAKGNPHKEPIFQFFTEEGGMRTVKATEVRIGK